MKVISYNSRILSRQEQKVSTLDCELLGILHTLQIYEFLIIGSSHPIHTFTDHKPLLRCFIEKSNLSPLYYRAEIQLSKVFNPKIIHSPGKKFSGADMKVDLLQKHQISELKHKQLPPHIDFANNNTLQPLHFLIKHEEVLPHQKHDSHPILADYCTDQFSIGMNDKSKDVITKPLDSFSFRSVTTFQSKFKTPNKKTTNLFINNLFT